MPRVESSVLIARPVGEVFGYVEEWTHAAEFTENLLSWQPTSERTDGVGATFAATMRIGPTTQRSTLEIVRREVDAEIAWESRAGFEQQGAYTFAAEGGGTRVGFVLDVTLPGGIAGRLIGKVMESFARDNTATTLANLKRILEGEPPGSATRLNAPA